MKIWIVSDVYLEFGSPFSTTPPPDADVMVCAVTSLPKELLGRRRSRRRLISKVRDAAPRWKMLCDALCGLAWDCSVNRQLRTRPLITAWLQSLFGLDWIGRNPRYGW